jgi:membrane glycosyltransferase
LADTSARATNTCNPLLSPYAHALHIALLPNEILNRRQLHYLQGLMYKVMDEGLESLSTNEARELFSQEPSLRELHCWLWSTQSTDTIVQSKRCQDALTESKQLNAGNI